MLLSFHGAPGTLHRSNASFSMSLYSSILHLLCASALLKETSKFSVNDTKLEIIARYTIKNPSCRSAFRGRQTWRWHVKCTIVAVQYNKMLLQRICPAIRAHNLMKDMVGMVELLMQREGGRGPDYVWYKSKNARAAPAGVSVTAWPSITTYKYMYHDLICWLALICG